VIVRFDIDINTIDINTKTDQTLRCCNKKFDKVYSLEYTDILKVLLTPHHVGHCCTMFQCHYCATMFQQ
jgi:hypothetical protein